MIQTKTDVYYSRQYIIQYMWMYIYRYRSIDIHRYRVPGYWKRGKILLFWEDKNTKMTAFKVCADCFAEKTQTISGDYCPVSSIEQVLPTWMLTPSKRHPATGAHLLEQMLPGTAVPPVIPGCARAYQHTGVQAAFIALPSQSPVDLQVHSLLRPWGHIVQRGGLLYRRFLRPEGGEAILQLLLPECLEKILRQFGMV